MKKSVYLPAVLLSSFFMLNPAFCEEDLLSEEPEVEVLDMEVPEATEGVDSASSSTLPDAAPDTEASAAVSETDDAFDPMSASSETSEVSTTEEYGDDIGSLVVHIPDAKRPKTADSEKVEAAQKKDADNKEFEENSNTLTYGTPTEINKVVDDIVENEDPRYTNALYDLFQATASSEVKQKILGYFGKLEDPCLEDYAVEILDDPYDTPNSLVQECMTYASSVHSKAAAPALVKLLDGEDEKYFNGALTALGKTGGTKEAKYLAKYLKRDDLETPQRQALMRTLGQMKAVETFDEVCEIAQNEDENSFVRMYAAEALGGMKKNEAIPILVSMYESGDPNMREYCIKGLQNFPDSEKAKNTIIQGIRDDHVKVRLQSIKSAKEMNLTDATDFLIYRAKNDSENSVKKECYPALAALDTKKGNDFLVERLTDKKAPDSTKLMASEAILKSDLRAGTDEIAQLAKDTVNDDKRKPLRYGLGKLLAKYTKPVFAEVCSMYIQSKDAQTAALGLDMYKAGRYETAVSAVKELANDKTRNSTNRKRARKILGLEEEEESKDTGTGAVYKKTDAPETKKPETPKTEAPAPSTADAK